MKQGRPKEISKAKNRVHSIVFTDRAEFVYRQLQKNYRNSQNKELPRGWLNRKLSELLIDNLGVMDDILKYEQLNYLKLYEDNFQKHGEIAKQRVALKQSEKTKSDKEEEARAEAEAEEQAKEEPEKVLKNVLDATRSQVLI